LLFLCCVVTLLIPPFCCICCIVFRSPFAIRSIVSSDPLLVHVLRKGGQFLFH
jgi:hypothetical protein